MPSRDSRRTDVQLSYRHLAICRRCSLRVECIRGEAEAAMRGLSGNGPCHCDRGNYGLFDKRPRDPLVGHRGKQP